MTTHATLDASPGDLAGWQTAGRMLDALSRRDFAAMTECLDREVRFRALVPRGPFELLGRASVRETFERWFGGEDGFELVDAAIGQLGQRSYLRWRVRMVPVDGLKPPRVAEQHVFAGGHDRIESLDLLCSGFQAEAVVSACPMQMGDAS